MRLWRGLVPMVVEAVVGMEDSAMERKPPEHLRIPSAWTGKERSRRRMQSEIRRGLAHEIRYRA